MSSHPARSFLVLATLVALASTATSQQYLWMESADATRTGLGSALAFAGDVDGDGSPELVAGCPYGSGLKGVVEILSTLGERTVLSIPGSAPGDLFGASVDGNADFDRDGVPDFVIGAPGAWSGAGEVCVVSGRDGTRLFQVAGMLPGDALGTAVAFAGDVDGDGWVDVAAGAPGHDGSALDAGTFSVWSGFDGVELLRIDGEAPFDALGQSCAAPGDVDDDFRADLVIGVPGSDRFAVDAGRTICLSGDGGTLLWSVPGASLGAGSGFSLAAVGDVSGDGRGDVVVGAPNDAGGGVGRGTARCLSGFDGGELLVVAGDVDGDGLGWSVGAAGDATGDGIVDFVASAALTATFVSGGSAATSAPGFGARVSRYAKLVSGADGWLVHRITDGAWQSGYGAGLAPAGDVNGDGHDDLALGAPSFGLGALYLFSGEPVAMDVDRIQVGSAGGPINLSLRLGPAHSGNVYWIFGTTAGTAPGLPLGGGVVLPLKPDWYFLMSIWSANRPPFSANAGYLDGAGEALATVTLSAPVAVALRGATLHHAAVIGASYGGLETTNAVAVTIVP